MDVIYKDCEQKMQKSLRVFSDNLAKIRTGRAQPSILDGVMVLYFDVLTPLRQVATIVVEDARTLVVTPFEASMVQSIDKAIRISNLGLNPAAQGKALRVPLPPLTQETRNNMIKQVKSYVEEAKVSIRQERREANDKLKHMLKNKILTQDEEKKAQDNVQKQTDKFIHEIDTLAHNKEKELNTI